MWNNSRIIGSFCFVFERTNSPNKKTIFGWVILLYPKLPSEFVFKFGGIFYVLFRAVIYLLIRSKIYQYIAYQRTAGNQLKKFLPVQRYFTTLKVEVQSPYNRITISYNRKGHRAFAVFLCRFLLESAVGLFLDMRCRSPPLHLDFLHFKNSDGRYLW